MAGLLERPDASQVVTLDQSLTHPRWLGSIGHVTDLTYSYSCPGGCDQFPCTLQIPAAQRTDALNPGRFVRVYRGASIIWAGKLDEPQPSATGWTVTAHGAGTFGADFAAVYSGSWSSTTPDTAINNAIGRGLPWVNSGVNSVTGLWTGQANDSGSQQITDMLNLICTKGGITWYVACTAAGENVLSAFVLPTAVTNLLVATTPVARTLNGDVNTIFVRYQDITSDYLTTSVTNTASVALYGPIETYVDLSSANVMSAGAAQAVGNLVLNRYQAISFAGPFTVGPGQLLTTGGAPVDVGAGMPYKPMVCRLMLTDFGYGGQVTAAPVEFLVGEYAYDDDSQTATITPFQALDTSFSGLLSMITSTEPVRHNVLTTTKSVA